MRVADRAGVVSPKGVYPHTHIKPRTYPPELVEQVRRLYVDQCMTIAEVQQAIGPGIKVQTMLRNHGIERRRPVARSQVGESNNNWRGDAARYAGLHRRVYAARGRASRCTQCDATSGPFEWANLTGRYEDLDDYAEMCSRCHKRYDATRRAETGRRTMPEGR